MIKLIYDSTEIENAVDNIIYDGMYFKHYDFMRYGYSKEDVINHGWTYEYSESDRNQVHEIIRNEIETGARINENVVIISSERLYYRIQQEVKEIFKGRRLELERYLEYNLKLLEINRSDLFKINVEKVYIKSLEK